MTTVRFKLLNESTIVFDSDNKGVIYDIDNYFAFFNPGYQYAPLFKAHHWDGKTHLVSAKKQQMPSGLKTRLKVYCREHGYNLQDETDIEPLHNDIDSLDDFIRSLHLPYDLRSYQKEGIRYALEQEKCLVISPTGSGKSIILYTLVRWYHSLGKHIVLIVPSTSLVEQMISDFRDYASIDDTFDVDSVVGGLYSGKDTDPYKTPILISTWQSLVNYEKELHYTWDVVLADEVHNFDAKVAKKLIAQCINAKARVGVSGSLSGELLEEYTLIGLFGEIKQVVTTKQLQSEGSLSPLAVTMINIKYTRDHVKEFYEFCKARRIQDIEKEEAHRLENGLPALDETARSKLKNKITYPDEVEYLISVTKRNLLIRNLALACKGTTMLLFNRKEHGMNLYNLIKEKVGDTRGVFHIDGDVDPKKREEIRSTINAGKDCILVASIQTSATGLNIPSIENLIMFPSKSKIRSLQSVGRGLRLKEGKSACSCYVIVDDFSNYRRRKSYSVGLGFDQYQVFVKEQFDVKFKLMDEF